MIWSVAFARCCKKPQLVCSEPQPFGGIVGSRRSNGSRLGSLPTEAIAELGQDLGPMIPLYGPLFVSFFPRVIRVSPVDVVRLSSPLVLLLDLTS